MMNQKYHIYLSREERSIVLNSLNELRNDLIEQGRYTDVVDELIHKVMTMKLKKIKIKYV